jgi:uncharacterized membrane protein (DUF485 family)
MSDSESRASAGGDPVPSARSGPASPADAHRQHLDSAEFHALAARKDLVSWILTSAAVAVYFGFIFLVAFRKDLVGARITAHMTWGIPLGIGVIVVSWLLTGIYVWWANRTYDVMVAELRRKWGR